MRSVVLSVMRPASRGAAGAAPSRRARPPAPRPRRTRTPGAPPAARRRRARSRGAAVRVVVVPPLVRRRLGVALRRVLPRLLAAERRDVEVAPGAAHRLVAAAVDEVRAEDAVAVAQEGVRPVPLVHPEVGV